MNGLKGLAAEWTNGTLVYQVELVALSFNRALPYSRKIPLSFHVLPNVEPRVGSLYKTWFKRQFPKRT